MTNRLINNYSISQTVATTTLALRRERLFII